MKSTTLASLLLGATALAALAQPALGPVAEANVDAPAPNVTATTWFNHIGADFDLASLKGQAVVLEFWATW